MKRLSKWMWAAAGIVLASGLASTGVASAAVSTGTLNRPGDLTIDSSTGKEFLDLTETQNQSVNDVMSGSFVTDQGFGFGTLAEYNQLLRDAGATDFSGDFNTADAPAVENVVDNLLGNLTPKTPFTLAGTTISNGFYAFVDDPGAPAGQVTVVGADYKSADDFPSLSQDQGRVLDHFNTFGPDFSSPIAGTLLVRPTTVPEPASLPAGLALVGALVLLRRRRRCAA